jgi:hypothetical protein
LIPDQEVNILLIEIYEHSRQYINPVKLSGQQKDLAKKGSKRRYSFYRTSRTATKIPWCRLNPSSSTVRTGIQSCREYGRKLWFLGN